MTTYQYLGGSTHLDMDMVEAVVAAEALRDHLAPSPVIHGVKINVSQQGSRLEVVGQVSAMGTSQVAVCMALSACDEEWRCALIAAGLEPAIDCSRLSALDATR